jgi:hypothetical protein
VKIPRSKSITEYTADVVNDGDCDFVLDVGCGGFSPLTVHRPKIKTIGIDAFPMAIARSKSKDLHDHYVLADVLDDNLNDLTSTFGIEKFDLVTLYGVIEHFPKRLGYELLEKCEDLTSKYVLLETPNGFCEQGPEFGNEGQRHLSGWSPWDFEGLGYKVYGTCGSKYLRGYNADLKYRHTSTIELILNWALNINKNPRHAFNLTAIKDVRGVPARLAPQQED